MSATSMCNRPGAEPRQSNTFPFPLMQESNTRPISVADEVKNSFLDYSMSVIISRALPDVRDGLKPSQRRILYAMHELSLYPPKKHVKCAKIAGDTSGNYHPHGEAVIYPTLVHMGQQWAMRETLDRSAGELRFGGRRSAGGHALHRGAHDAPRRHADAGHGQGHGQFRAQLRRAPHRALRVPGGVPEPHRQRRHRHRGRHGHQHAAAQPRRSRRCASARRSTIRRSRPRRSWRTSRGRTSPRAASSTASGGIREYMETGHGAVRIRGVAEIVEHGNREQIIITEIPFNVNRAELEKKIADAGEREDHPGNQRRAQRVGREHPPGRRSEEATPAPRWC